MLLRTLVYEGSDPRAWGAMHGEALRADVRAMVEIRTHLVLEKTDLASRENVRALARLHLPLLRRFDKALADEIEGIARGADVPVEDVIILNHYTDLRDLSRSHLAAASTIDSDPGGCSVIFAPLTSGPVLGQTWDMHGSATDHVVLLDVPAPSGERTLLFTIAGCVGMTGLTSWGLGMTINNLNSTDARLGIVWPALVRRALREKTAEGARDVVMNAPLGSGHHYLVASADALYGVETSGTKKKLSQQGVDRVHLHTNHCLDPAMKDTARILPTSSTLERYAGLESIVHDGLPSDARGLYASLARVSMARTPSEPHKVATCGALVMDLARRHAYAGIGVPGVHAPLVFDLST
jgi:isopenicillin-N N-acyltransferase-like protein